MKRDLLFGITIFIITLILQLGLLVSKSVRFDDGGMSSTAFPQMVLIVLFILSIIQMFIAIKDKKNIILKLKDIDFSKYKVSAKIIIILFVYIILMDKIGFYTSTFIYILATIKMLNIQNNKFFTSLLVSAGTTGLMFLVFSIWLRLYLPSGILL